MARLHSTITAAARIKLPRIFMEYKNKRHVELDTELGPFLTREKREKSMRLSLYLTNPHASFYHACTPTRRDFSTILTQCSSRRIPPKNPTQPSSSHFYVTASLLLVSFVQQRLCFIVWCVEPSTWLMHRMWQRLKLWWCPLDTHLHPLQLISSHSN